MNITLCIICKDEEDKIVRCINSCKNMVNEVVVVDTGSMDKTIEIVKQQGIDVLEQPWENDFSKARNYAIDHANGEWIIFLDADEYFTKDCKEEVHTAIANAKRNGNEYILCQIVNLGNKGVGNCFKTIRIFENKKSIRYYGKIHERLMKANGTLKGEDCSGEIEIYHDGYMTSAVEKQNKNERNSKMLMEELRKHPTSSDIHFYLMQQYMSVNDEEGKVKAWEYGTKAMAYNNFELTSVKEVIYANLLHLCTNLDKDIKETKEIYNKAITGFNDYPDIEFWYAYYLCEHGDVEGCISHLESCLRKAAEYKDIALSMIISQLPSVMDYLAECYIHLERFDKALATLVKLLRVNPYKVKALKELIEIVQQGETTEVIGVFLSKLYNLNKERDVITLLAVTEAIHNTELFNYISDHAASEITEKYNSRR